MTRFAGALALLLVLSSPALAQRPESVTLTVATGLPIADRAAVVTVAFGDPVPVSASLFVSTTGQGTYSEFAGTFDGDDAFRVTVPAELVTLRGLEVYSQFVMASGQTFTQPEQDPEDAPIRVPTLILRAESAVVPGARQHRMVSLPLQLLPDLGAELGVLLSGDRAADIFGDDYGDPDPSLWRVFQWDPLREAYADTPAAVGTVRPGEGLWVISAAGGAFDVENAISSGVGFDGPDPFAAPTAVTLQPGWNQIGTPFGVPTDWATVEGRQFTGLPVGHDGTGFRLDQTTLQPWQGYFVENQTNNPVEIRFRPGPSGSPGSDVSTESFAQKAAAAAGPGAHVVRLRAEADGSADAETYVGWSPSAAPGALDRRDPPAVAGVDLAIEGDDGGAWASRVAGAPRVWTLRLTVPAGTRRATVSAETLAGDGALALFDLDRGARLALDRGEVSVAVAPGETVRRLRLVLDGADPTAPALALGVGPNPVAVGGQVALRAELPAAWATVEVFDALGRRVARLWDAPVAAGLSEWGWRPSAPGLYVARLTADGAVTTRPVSVVR